MGTVAAAALSALTPATRMSGHSPLPLPSQVENVEDDALVWRLEVIEFDEEPGKHDDPGGQLK